MTAVPASAAGRRRRGRVRHRAAPARRARARAAHPPAVADAARRRLALVEPDVPALRRAVTAAAAGARYAAAGRSRGAPRAAAARRGTATRPCRSASSAGTAAGDEVGERLGDRADVVALVARGPRRVRTRRAPGRRRVRGGQRRPPGRGRRATRAGSSPGRTPAPPTPRTRDHRPPPRRRPGAGRPGRRRCGRDRGGPARAPGHRGRPGPPTRTCRAAVPLPSSAALVGVDRRDRARPRGRSRAAPWSTCSVRVGRRDARACQRGAAPSPSAATASSAPAGRRPRRPQRALDGDGDVAAGPTSPGVRATQTRSASLGRSPGPFGALGPGIASP